MVVVGGELRLFWLTLWQCPGGGVYFYLRLRIECFAYLGIPLSNLGIYLWLSFAVNVSVIYLARLSMSSISISDLLVNISLSLSMVIGRGIWCVLWTSIFIGWISSFSLTNRSVHWIFWGPFQSVGTPELWSVTVYFLMLQFPSKPQILVRPPSAFLSTAAVKWSHGSPPHCCPLLTTFHMPFLVCFHLHVMVTRLFQSLVYPVDPWCHISLLHKFCQLPFILLRCMFYILHFRLDKDSFDLCWYFSVTGSDHTCSPSRNIFSL